MMKPGERRYIPKGGGQFINASHGQTLFASQQSRSPLQSGGSAPTAQKDSLASISNPLLMIGIKLQSAADTGTPESLKKLLYSYFDEFEAHSFSAGKSREITERAKYALAAFIDEIALSRSGELHDAWVSEPLTLKFFNDPNGGENFYSQLENLIGNISVYIEAVEVFYLCLVLGFQGRYKIAGREKLPVIIENLLKRIESVNGQSKKILSPSANIPPGPVPARKNSRRWIIASAVILCLSVIYYLALSALSSNGIEEAVPAVKEIESLFYKR